MKSMNNETRAKFQIVLDILAKETIEMIEANDIYYAKSNTELMQLLALKMNFGDTK